MNKAAIRKFAEWARERLIDDITYKAGTLGITEKGIAEKLPQSTGDMQFFDIGTKNYAEVSGKEIAQRDALVNAIQTKEKSFPSYQEAFENVVEEVAYTWFNRLTIGNMRVEYLHRMQRIYDKEIERMQEIMDNSKDNKEISTATRRKEKLQRQIKETKEYDAKVAHLALARIDIDLDDGVKVNYEKVQTAPDGQKIQILARI